MRVLELWRYPVKSMRGERLDSSYLTEAGLDGDRQWGIVDRATDKMLTARREPRLLHARARLGEDRRLRIDAPKVGSIEIGPDGDTTDASALLSRWLGRDVSLVARNDVSGGQAYEIATDFENEATSPWVSWQGPERSFHDSTRTAVSILAVGSLGDWDRRRFRGNVIVGGDEDPSLVGAALRCGDLRLDVTKRIDRCVMVTRPQPADDDGPALERDLTILREINAQRATVLGLGCLVGSNGTLSVGADLVADI